MIVRVAGSPPIRGRQPLYFMDGVFLERAKIPPPADTDRIGIEITGKTTVKAPPTTPAPAAAGNPGKPPEQSGGAGNGIQPEQMAPGATPERQGNSHNDKDKEL
jgi:hypothetical protein